MRKPHVLQALQSADQQHALLPVQWIAGRLIHVNQPALRFTLQRAIRFYWQWAAMLAVLVACSTIYMRYRW